jgi:hypothetical protein
VYGQTREEHDKILWSVLKRSQEQGIKFNKDKLEVGVTRFKYSGQLLIPDGLSPDPDKVSAVIDMATPNNKS